MALITLPFIFSPATTIISSQVNSVNTTIFNDYNGNINDSNISPTAAIEYTKLALSGTIKQSDISSIFNNNSGFGLVPSGGIIMWSGSIANIPTGWFLCNGSNGTPNLTNQFIVCANADSAGTAMTTITGGATQSGGNVNHTHDYTHTHTVGVNSNTGAGHISANNESFTTDSQSTTTTGNNSTVAVPYFAIAYIMKS